MKPEFKTGLISQKENYILRPAKAEDFENYYLPNYCPLDPEVARLTGSRPDFSRKEVESFFKNAIEDPEICLFLVEDEEGNIIGESVINEIDWHLKKANFRIALYQQTARGKGIGTWVVKATRDFAFEVLKLHRLELDVFSFNPKAEKVYQKAGFRREGVLRDAVAWPEGMDKSAENGNNGNNENGSKEYADDILMAMLEDEFWAIKQQEQEEWQGSADQDDQD